MTRISSQETAIMSSEAFAQGHPDLFFLRAAMGYYRRGEHSKALTNFDLSAGYGEKMSQAMLAEMYWKGVGTPVNRPRAYAMIDIAAERGTNPDLLRIRENYWESLNADERNAAIALGPEIVAKYSDEVAMKKLAMAFRKDKFSRMRVSPGQMQQFLVAGSAEDAPEFVRADQFYAKKFWEPQEYMKIRDDLTNRVLRNGRVKVQFSGKVDAPRSADTDPQD